MKICICKAYFSDFKERLVHFNWTVVIEIGEELRPEQFAMITDKGSEWDRIELQPLAEGLFHKRSGDG